MRSASAAARYVAVQRDADLQSLRNQAEDALVRDTVLEEAQNPAMAHGIEEALDVRGEHPVHLPPVHPGVKRIQRVMLPTPRPKPIGEAHESLPRRSPLPLLLSALRSVSLKSNCARLGHHFDSMV